MWTLTTPIDPDQTTVRVEKFDTDGINYDSGPFITMYYTVGKVVDTVYIPKTYHKVSLTSATVQDKMNEETTPGTVYSNIKSALYNGLYDDGFIGAGTMT